MNEKLAKFVADIRETVKLHPSVVYTNSSYLTFDTFGDPDYACALGFAVLARKSSLSADDMDVLTNDDTTVCELLDDLYPELAGYHLYGAPLFDEMDSLNQEGYELDTILDRVLESAEEAKP